MSHLRRPLALAALAYVLLLCSLRAQGGLRSRPAPQWLERLGPAEVEGLVLSGSGQGRQGRWFRLCAQTPGVPAAVVLVYAPRTHADAGIPLPGQRAWASGRLRRPRPPVRPGGFDEQAVMEWRGCALIMHAKVLETVDAAVPWPWGPWAWAGRARRSLRGSLRALFPPDSAAILEGMMIGTKRPLHPALARAVRDSGVTHLLVASGTNVGCLMTIALWAGARLGLRRLWALAAAAGACGFYALMAGADAPVMRACLCAFVVPAAAALGREPGGFQAWLLSGLALLAADPAALFSPGFQLSYAASLGLLIAAPRWRLPVRWPVPARLAVYALLASAAAQVSVLPILARQFGRVSVVGILANALWVPLSALILPMGFVVWGLAVLAVPGALPACAALLGLLAAAFGSSCRFFASLPLAAVDVSPFGPAATAAYAAGALGLLALPNFVYSLPLRLPSSVRAERDGQTPEVPAQRRRPLGGRA